MQRLIKSSNVATGQQNRYSPVPRKKGQGRVGVLIDHFLEDAFIRNILKLFLLLECIHVLYIFYLLKNQM